MTVLADVLAEHGVSVVPTHAMRGPRQTHAIRTLERLFEAHGADHVRDVLAVILESENNALALVAPVIVAVSALLLAHDEWWQRDASAWLSVFDRLNLLEIHSFVKKNRRAAKVSDALSTEIYRRLFEVFGPPRTQDLFDMGSR